MGEGRGALRWDKVRVVEERVALGQGGAVSVVAMVGGGGRTRRSGVGWD